MADNTLNSRDNSLKLTRRKLKGYLYAYRDRFQLLSEKILTQEEFLLNELCISLCDWDSKHKNYGTFKATDQELARLLGYSNRSRSSVCGLRNSLIKKEFLQQLPNGWVEPRYFERWKSPQNRKITKYDSVLNNEQNVRNIEQSEAESVSFSVSSNKGLGNKGKLSDEEVDWIIKDLGKDNSSVEIESFSKTPKPNLETIGEMSWDEVLITCKEIFGDQVAWEVPNA